ncbi:MAG: hypothetical protein OEU26_33290 [Candidatus Tectomicrobia bacterium]|nr:hypothetical protein [Candidatus Tectomicrobia bacterium]
MTKEEAMMLDAQDLPVDAAQVYEKVIAASDADFDTFMNLAVLYFVCVDGGYATHHGLSREFINDAWERAYELLDEAESRFGKQSEITFWRYYFRFVVLGEAPLIETCKDLLQSGSSLVPSFYLFTSPGGDLYRSQALQLLERVKEGTTAKQRYIRSILAKRLNVVNAPE